MNYYKKMTRKILLAITIASALIFTNVGMPLSSFQIKRRAQRKKRAIRRIIILQLKKRILPRVMLQFKKVTNKILMIKKNLKK